LLLLWFEAVPGSVGHETDEATMCWGWTGTSLLDDRHALC